MNTELIHRAAKLLRGAKHLTAFTGAGISVESGIPPFRGANGIWSRYDPGVLDIDRYRSWPDETWPVINEIFYRYFATAVPNQAHFFLSRLQQEGLLKGLITQNIDNLHQDAGNTDVIEYHGNSQYMVCTYCGERRKVEEPLHTSEVPRCSNEGALMKPDFIFFGEPIPQEAAERSLSEARQSDVMLLIGTTGEVMPASMIPKIAKQAGATIIEINTEETAFTQSVTDLFLKGRATEVCGLLQQEMELLK
jgi:NAD-dependent deacetylase